MKRLLLEQEFDSDEIARLSQEVQYLTKHGLFDPSSSYYSFELAKKLRNQMKIDTPITQLQLEMAGGCNLACKYCYCSVSRDMPTSGLMRKSVAKEAIDQLLRQDITDASITMFGGEPLLNKSLFTYIMDYVPREAKKLDKKINYVITTNATLLDDEIINYIVNFNFGLMVSLDGPKELHDQQCPTKSGEGSFELAVQKIKTLMTKRSVSVRATMIHPIPDLKGLIDFFVEFGFYNMAICAAINRIDAKTVTDFTKDDVKKLCQQEENILPWMLEFLKRKKYPPYFTYDNWYNDIAHDRIDCSMKTVNCGAGVNTLSVDTSGNYYPCAKFLGMKNWQIGNIKDGIDNEKRTDIWSRFLQCIKPKCSKCWAYHICKGPCIWECSKNDGTFKFNDILCEYKKKGIENSAYLHMKVRDNLDRKESNEVAQLATCNI